MNPPLDFHKCLLIKDLRSSVELAAHHLPTDTRRADSDLTALVDAWPTLPEAIRAGIVAMVRASVIPKHAGPHNDDAGPGGG